MKWKLNPTYWPLNFRGKLNPPEYWKLVYYLAKFIGLAPFVVKDNRLHRPSLLGILHVVFVVTSYLAFVYLTFTLTVGKLNAGDAPVLAKVWSTALYFVNLPSTFATPIMLLLMYKEVAHLVNKLFIVNNELRFLDVDQDHGKFFKDLFVTVVISNVVLIAACVLLCFIETEWHTFLSIKYAIDSWFSFNTVFVFAQVLIYIKQRFAMVNQRLYDLLIPVNHLTSQHRRPIFVVSRNHPKENKPESEVLTGLHHIRKMKTLHLELRDLVDRTTCIFATPILCNSVRIFSQIMLSSYWIYLVLQNLSKFHVITIFCAVLRIIIAIVMIFVIAYASATVCEQGNATKVVLPKAWMRFRPAGLRDEFVMFSTQLLKTPVVVSAFGFMDLDYSFLFKIICAALTYLIVTIQFPVR